MSIVPNEVMEYCYTDYAVLLLYFASSYSCSIIILILYAHPHTKTPWM